MSGFFLHLSILQAVIYLHRIAHSFLYSYIAAEEEDFAEYNYESLLMYCTEICSKFVVYIWG